MNQQYFSRLFSGVSPRTGSMSALLALMATLVMLPGCSTPLRKAPIIERQPTTILEDSPRAQMSAQASRESPQVAPPGYYIVKKGDTLIGIGLDTGNDWRELAAWNNLDNPNRILVGQQLRIVSPGIESNAVSEVKPITAPVEVRAVADPVPRKTADSGLTPAAAVVGGVPVAPPAKPAVPGVEKATDKSAEKPADKSVDKGSDKANTERADGASLPWTWPANGTIIEGFSETRNKGIDIALKAGDAVSAALDGQVVYAGSALRGYGNLIIVKHQPGYLTAYAHNRKLLVKEGEAVKRGQQIAEAGNTDAERVKLHFEIRKGGKPVDPVKYLPLK